MNSAERKLQSLLEQIETRERSARRRSLLYTLVPVLVAAILIVFTVWQVGQANLQLAAARRQLAASQSQLAAVNGSLGSASSDLTAVQDELARTREELSAAQSGLKAAREELTSTHDELNATEQQLAAARERLKAAQQQVNTLTADVARYQRQVEDLNATIQQVQADLQAATQVEQNLYPGKPAAAAQYIAAAQPAQSALLEDLLASQSKVSWQLGGLDPQAGLDFPSFAAYIMEKHKLIDQPFKDARYNLRKLLPRAGSPQLGDVVFYKLGYVMFYFRDQNGKPFVVGMTPDGIVAVDPNFAEIASYGRVKY